MKQAVLGTAQDNYALDNTFALIEGHPPISMTVEIAVPISSVWLIRTAFINVFREGHGFTGCRKKSRLYQGAASAVPLGAARNAGFSP